MRRFAAPCPISASSTSRASSKSTKRPQHPAVSHSTRVPHHDRTVHRRRPGPARPGDFTKPRCGSPAARSSPWVRTTDHGSPGIDASGLMVLPGIVDLHGDAFERQMMPRPGVDFPDRCGAGRQRPAGDQQRHHDRLSRHDLVVGARPAQRRQCAADCWRRSSRCGRNSPPTPASICATRPTISMRKAKSSTGCRKDAIDLFAFNDHMDSTVASLAKPQKRSRMVERTGLTNEAFDRTGAKRRFPRPRRPGVDRPAGAGGARGWCPDAVA